MIHTNRCKCKISADHLMNQVLISYSTHSIACKQDTVLKAIFSQKCWVIDVNGAIESSKAFDTTIRA